MQISGAGWIFLIGCAGGGCLEFLRWWKLRTSLNWPAYAWKLGYWVLTLGMIVIGGGIAVLYYGAGPTNGVAVANIGASAPAIIGAFASQSRDKKEGGTRKFDGSTSVTNRVLRFLAFG